MRLLLALSLAPLAIFACSSSDSSSTKPTTGASDGGPSVAAEPLFRALQDDLVATCGGTNGTCHVQGAYNSAPTWLGGPDPYVSATHYKGVLPATKDAADSILLTQVQHEGPSLPEAPNDLFTRVSAWLSAEVPGPPLPNTGALVIRDGFNSVPLDAVASGLSGARITFLATETVGAITLSSLQIVPPNNANVTLDSPFFVVLPRNGKVKADPDADGFKGTVTANAGVATDLFTGNMTLLRWDPSGRLKIAFNSISATPATAPTSGCTALDLFKSSALPAMNMTVQVLATDEQGEPIAGQVSGQGSCLGCHGAAASPGQAPSTPVQAMDLRAAATDPAAACVQAKLWINKKNKDQSTILLNPIGQGNQLHPMQPVDANDPIETGLKAWVEAEQ